MTARGGSAARVDSAASADSTLAEATGTTVGSDWLYLEPELLVLKVATRRLVKAATERTRVGRAVARIASVPVGLVERASGLSVSR